MSVNPIDIQTILAKTAEVAKREGQGKHEILAAQTNKEETIEEKHRIHDRAVQSLREADNSEKKVKDRRRDGSNQEKQKKRQGNYDDGKGSLLDIEA